MDGAVLLYIAPRFLCIDQEGGVPVFVSGGHSHQVTRVVDRPGFPIRVHNILGGKEAVDRALQRGVPLGFPLASLRIRLVELQVPLVDMNTALRPVIPDLEGVEDGVRVTIGGNVYGRKVIIDKVRK